MYEIFKSKSLLLHLSNNLTDMKNKVIDISEDVKWIGIIDPDLVTFDVVMETRYGTTYNSFYINADKKTIVDATKEEFWEDYLQKIHKVCNPEEIDYIVVNHTEPDHTGNVKNLLRLAPRATVVGTGNAIRYLHDLMGVNFNYLVVRDGHTLSLGNKTLRFISAPNLHWPDTMFTYVEEEKILFSCDSFGAHFSGNELFEDEVERRDEYEEAFKYYYDVILKPYSKFMLKAIGKIDDLDIETICTGHGPILRKNWKKIVDKSKELSERALARPTRPRVFIPYVSAYQKTGIIARLIAEGIQQAGDIDVDVCDIEMLPMGELEEKITRASAYIIGSPTINQNILLPIYKCFALINPIRDKGKPAAAFGSFGWSGEAKKLITDNLINLKLKLFDEGMFVKFTPDKEDSEAALAFGKAFGAELISYNN